MDSHLRLLRRRWALSGAIEDEIALRVAHQRAGLLSGDEALELQALQLEAGQLTPTPFPLLHVFPVDDGEEDLYWFLRKATGSYKAPPMLDGAQTALVQRLSTRSESALSEAYEQTLQSSLPELPPYRTPQPWLDQASQHPDVFSMTGRVLVGARPRHPRSRYDNWGEPPFPEDGDLLHDAMLFCWRRWSGEIFLRLTRSVLKDHMVYNSLDLVAAMLFTIAAWSSLGA